MPLVIVITLFIKLTAWFINPQVILTPDSFGYYETGQRLYQAKISVDASRMPIYPLLITLPAYLSGRINTPAESPVFYKDMRLIVYLQLFIAVFSLGILYRLLYLAGLNKNYAFTFTMLALLLNTFSFASERYILSESLTASWLIITVYFSYLLLKKYTSKNLILLFFLLVFGFFLKPFYTLFPFLILGFVNIYHRQRKVLFSSLIILAVFTLVVFSWQKLNWQFYQYRGISRISDYNLLGVILVRNLNIENAKNNPLYPSVVEYKQQNRELTPFRLMESVDYNYYKNTGLVNRMQQFNRQVIFADLPQYVIKSLAAIPQAQTENLKPLSFLTLIVIPGFIWQIFEFWRKKELIVAFYLLIGAVSCYQIILTVFFSYGEFGRLLSPAWPFIYLFSFYCWFRLGKKLLN